MKCFPMFIRLEGQKVVIAGGGEEAAQKARLIRKTEARIVLMAPTLNAELSALVKDGFAKHCPRVLDEATLEGARLVFVAAGDLLMDTRIAELARAKGATVNVVDRPELCDAFTPAIVDRDPVIVAIGTEGAAPIVARQIKTRLEELLEPRLGVFVALAGKLRGAVAKQVPARLQRSFWRWVFSQAPRQAFIAGEEGEAERLLRSAIKAGGKVGDVVAEAPKEGLVSLVEAGEGAADLLTLRALQRLQEADTIIYDRQVNRQILELARRDAVRIAVDRPSKLGRQRQINEILVKAASAGQRVVRLGAISPHLGTEQAFAAHGIQIENIPTSNPHKAPQQRTAKKFAITAFLRRQRPDSFLSTIRTIA